MLIITILSLLMAATMGWLALKLLRDEQRRSEARVAALTAALDEPWGAFMPQPVQDATPTPPPVARRAAPEIVAIDDHAGIDRDFASARDASDREPLDLAAQPTVEPNTEPDTGRPMFGGDADDARPRDDRRWLAIAGVLLVGLGIVSVLWSTSGASHTETTPAKAAAVAPGGVPVELLSLGHERTAAGLVVRGLVRNPTAGSTRTGTAASVFLFDRDGGFLGSGRSVLDTPTLAPGDEAAFEVTLPGNASVRRYRVTFRGMEGTVVPHVDKRPSTPSSPSGSGL